MRIGVVGLGFMGSTHLQAYQKIPGVQVAAVASSDPKKRDGDLSDIAGNLDVAGAKMDFGQAARYANAEALFADDDVEAVDLCVPTYLHAPLAKQALQAGKHVLVEKPMALSVEECDAMVEAARQNSKVLMVAQVIRFWPEYVAVRELIRAGRLGTIRSATFRRRCAAPGWSKWLHDRDKSGGGAFDLLIHDFDYCLQRFGKPDAVTAVGHEDMANGIDVVESRLHYGEGPAVTISGGWHNRGEYPFSMEFTIVGDEGVLEFHSALQPLTFYPKEQKPENPPMSEKGGFEAELEAFARACERGRPPSGCLPEDSALATRMTLAMRTSRERRGQPENV